MEDLTEAEVHAICDALDAEGIEPSVRKIREEAGRGSHSTITKYSRTWVAQRGRIVLPMPDAVNKHMAAISAGICGSPSIWPPPSSIASAAISRTKSGSSRTASPGPRRI